MNKVKFYQLDTENKLTAVTQMLHLSKTYNYCLEGTWKNEGSVWADLEQDYNPDEHFSFYLDEFEEVETKIGPSWITV